MRLKTPATERIAKKLAPVYLLCLISCESMEADSRPVLAAGRLGMVSSAHPLATEAGIEILAAGGNAFDAAVAIAATLNVTEPMMSGIGGYGTILVYDARAQRVRYLDASGRIPRAVDADVYRAPTENYLANRRGAKAVSTPGNVAAWESLANEYGQLPWTDLFAPAIRLAEQGFELDARLAGFITSAYGDFSTTAQEIYGRGGRPLAAGERLIQADLAMSLKLIATQGATAFYDGKLSRIIDKTMTAQGGFLSAADLRMHRAEWWDSIHIDYRGLEVHVPSPPANSFPALVRLGMMSRYPKGSMAPGSADYLHRYAEVTKHGFWSRLRWAGDPDVAPPPLDQLLSPTYWQQQVAKIDDRKAKPFVSPTEFTTANGNTTHFVVADQWGNVVSATQTLGNLFGSRIMPEGTGIWLNNSLAYCTFEPRGNPMDAHPGRRKLSGDVPAIIMRQGRPWIALGTPGGHTIPQTVPQLIINCIDFDMDLQAALNAGRISFIEPDLIAIEASIGAAVRQELEARGHKLREVQALGNAHALSISYDAQGMPRSFSGASDPRGAGLAKGY